MVPSSHLRSVSGPSALFGPMGIPARRFRKAANALGIRQRTRDGFVHLNFCARCRSGLSRQAVWAPLVCGFPPHHCAICGDHNPRVGGSIPSAATMLSSRRARPLGPARHSRWRACRESRRSSSGPFCVQNLQCTVDHARHLFRQAGSPDFLNRPGFLHRRILQQVVRVPLRSDMRSSGGLMRVRRRTPWVAGFATNHGGVRAPRSVSPMRLVGMGFLVSGQCHVLPFHGEEVARKPERARMGHRPVPGQDRRALGHHFRPEPGRRSGIHRPARRPSHPC